MRVTRSFVFLSCLVVLGGSCSSEEFSAETESSSATVLDAEGSSSANAQGTSAKDTNAQAGNDSEATSTANPSQNSDNFEASNEADGVNPCIINDRDTPGLDRQLDTKKGSLVIKGTFDDNVLDLTSMVAKGHVQLDDGSNRPITYTCLNRIEFHGGLGEDRLFVRYKIGSFRSLTNEEFAIFFDGGPEFDILSIIHGVDMVDVESSVADPDGFKTRLSTINLGN